MELRFRQRRKKKRSGLDFRVSDKRDKEIVETQTNKEERRWIFELDGEWTRKNEDGYSRVSISDFAIESVARGRLGERQTRWLKILEKRMLSNSKRHRFGLDGSGFRVFIVWIGSFWLDLVNNSIILGQSVFSHVFYLKKNEKKIIL